MNAIVLQILRKEVMDKKYDSANLFLKEYDYSKC